MTKKKKETQEQLEYIIANMEDDLVDLRERILLSTEDIDNLQKDINFIKAKIKGRK